MLKSSHKSISIFDRFQSWNQYGESAFTWIHLLLSVSWKRVVWILWTVYTYTQVCKYTHTHTQLQVFPPTQQPRIQFPVCRTTHSIILVECACVCVCAHLHGHNWNHALPLSVCFSIGLPLAVPLSHTGLDTHARTHTHITRAHSETQRAQLSKKRAQNHRWCVHARARVCVCVCECVLRSRAVSVAGLHPDLACLANASVTIDNIHTTTRQRGTQETWL